MQLIDYLPEFMQVYKELQLIMGTSQPLVDGVDKEIENFLSDLFILESTEKGTEHYENMLDISPKLTQTLEDRQYAVFLKYNETLPYTYKKLVEILDSICDEGQYDLKICPKTLTLDIKLNLKKKELLETVSDLLEEVLPVNIQFSVGLLYNLWSTVRAKTWLSVKELTWDSLLNENLE